MATSWPSTRTPPGEASTPRCSPSIAFAGSSTTFPFTRACSERTTLTRLTPRRHGAASAIMSSLAIADRLTLSREAGLQSPHGRVDQLNVIGGGVAGGADSHRHHCPDQRPGEGPHPKVVGRAPHSYCQLLRDPLDRFHDSAGRRSAQLGNRKDQVGAFPNLCPVLGRQS